MTSIVQISDTHFGTEQPAVVQALEDHVREHRADLLVFSGDITQRARRGQFASAAAFVRRLEADGVGDTLVIPGNHDIPLYNVFARLFTPYGNYRQHFGDDLEPVFENEQMLVIGLNTTHPRRHKDGVVTARQVERVARRLEESDPGKIRIVVAHQPFGAMVPSDLSNLQHGAEPALQRWASMAWTGHGRAYPPALRAAAVRAVSRARPRNLDGAGRHHALHSPARHLAELLQPAETAPGR